MDKENKVVDMLFDYETGEITPKLVPALEYARVINYINDLRRMEVNGINKGNINYDATKRAVDSYQKRLKRY